MVHRYRLSNPTQGEVKVVDVINRKTCCGIVRAEKMALGPGESTEIEVTLVVDDKFGEVAHETEVVTSPPSDPDIVLRTTAEAFAPFRVEEVASPGRAVSADVRELRRAEFQVFATGTAGDPPADLDRMALRSTIGVDWAGPKVGDPSPDGLRVESRRLTALLDPSGPPSERTAEILLRDDTQVRFTYVVHWDVVAPISASPGMIVLQSGGRGGRASLASHDRRPFRITRMECPIPGLRCRAMSEAAGSTQVVEVEGLPRNGEKRGVIAVFTDHPAQQKVDLPFLILD